MRNTVRCPVCERPGVDVEWAIVECDEAEFRDFNAACGCSETGFVKFADYTTALLEAAMDDERSIQPQVGANLGG